MAILPGSLDYLYYNGIIDHIPYEAYQMTPMTASGRAQLAGMGTGYGVTQMGYGVASVSGGLGRMSSSETNQYLDQAYQRNLYNTYTGPDCFVRRNPSMSANQGYGEGVDFMSMAYGVDGKNFRQSIMDSASKTKETVTNSSNWLKGLLALGVIVGTTVLLFKGRKAPVQTQATKPSFWQNIKSWFKK